MRYSADCDICPIVQAPGSERDRIEIVSGDYWLANLRTDDQSLLGTTYVTLRDHKESLTDLTLEEDSEFVEIRNDLIEAQMRAFGSEVVNISCLMNNTFQTDIPAPHVHYHFKPRYLRPIKFAGTLFTDTQFGHYPTPRERMPVDNALAHEIANKLRRFLPYE